MSDRWEERYKEIKAQLDWLQTLMSLITGDHHGNVATFDKLQDEQKYAVIAEFKMIAHENANLRRANQLLRQGIVDVMGKIERDSKNINPNYQLRTEKDDKNHHYAVGYESGKRSGSLDARTMLRNIFGLHWSNGSVDDFDDKYTGMEREWED